MTLRGRGGACDDKGGKQHRLLPKYDSMAQPFNKICYFLFLFRFAQPYFLDGVYFLFCPSSASDGYTASCAINIFGNSLVEAVYTPSPKEFPKSEQ